MQENTQPPSGGVSAQGAALSDEQPALFKAPKAKDPQSAVTAPEVMRQLQDRYSGDEWATFAELPDGTGSRKGRTIDFYALNLWPSKAYLSAAFEVKVSRADFRRELDNPGKRAPWEKLASECWFAAPAGIIPVEELPEGWGLLELTTDGFRAKRRAFQRKIDSFPPDFLASLARRTKDAPPPEPPLAWEWAGRKIGGAELMRLAEKQFRRREVDRSPVPAVQVHESERWRTVGPLIGRLNAAMGVRWGYPTLDQMEEWLKGRSNPDLAEVRRRFELLGNAIRDLGR